MVNYPYDDDKDGLIKYSQSPDDKVFQQVSRAYSQVTEHLNLFRAGIMSTFVFYVVTEDKVWWRVSVAGEETGFEK